MTTATLTSSPLPPSASQGFAARARRGAAPHAWLEDLYVAVRHEQIDHALDLIYASFNRLFASGRFTLASSLLRHVDLARLDTDTLVGLLAATLPAREELPDRPGLVARVRMVLQSTQPARIDALMRGLE